MTPARKAALLECDVISLLVEMNSAEIHQNDENTIPSTASIISKAIRMGFVRKMPSIGGCGDAGSIELTDKGRRALNGDA